MKLHPIASTLSKGIIEKLADFMRGDLRTDMISEKRADGRRVYRVNELQRVIVILVCTAVAQMAGAVLYPFMPMQKARSPRHGNGQ